jgi:hypothetical protein
MSYPGKEKPVDDRKYVERDDDEVKNCMGRGKFIIAYPEEKKCSEKKCDKKGPEND